MTSLDPFVAAALFGVPAICSPASQAVSLPLSLSHFQASSSAVRADAIDRSTELADLVEDFENEIAHSGGQPLPGALDEMLLLLAFLPEELRLPSLALEPQGGIAAEWSGTPTQTVVLSVNGTGNLEYAGVVDDVVFADSEAFRDRVPDHLLARIGEIQANVV